MPGIRATALNKLHQGLELNSHINAKNNNPKARYGKNRLKIPGIQLVSGEIYGAIHARITKTASAVLATRSVYRNRFN
jgi:hypothetical protein